MHLQMCYWLIWFLSRYIQFLNKSIMKSVLLRYIAQWSLGLDIYILKWTWLLTESLVVPIHFSCFFSLLSNVTWLVLANWSIFEWILACDLLFLYSSLVLSYMTSTHFKVNMTNELNSNSHFSFSRCARN